MAQPFLGEIILFASDFAPKNYMLCEGQFLDAIQNNSLHTLLGDAYGSRPGQFALPDLRGRVAIGQGQGPGLSNYPIGKSAGEESLSLTVDQMPSHTHAVTVASAATSNAPVNLTLANESLSVPAGGFIYAPFDAAAQVNLLVGSVLVAGSSEPHLNVQPVLALAYCMAVVGTVPTPA